MKNEKSGAAYDAHEQELQETDEMQRLSEEVLSLMQGDSGLSPPMRTESLSAQALALKMQKDQEALNVQPLRRTESLPAEALASSMHASPDSYALKIQEEQEGLNVQPPARTELVPAEPPDFLVRASSDSDAAKIQAAEALDVQPLRRTESAPAHLFNDHARPGAYYVASGTTELVAAELSSSRRGEVGAEDLSHFTVDDDAEISDDAAASEGGTIQLSEGISVVAVKVEAGAEEQRVRRKIFDEAIRADVLELVVEVPLNRKLRKSSVYLLVACGALALLGLVLGLSVGLANKNNDSGEDGTSKTTPPGPFMPTLEAVRQRGVLRCGHLDVFFHIRFDPVTHERVGFEVDLCRAIAAVALGDPKLFEIVDVPPEDRFMELANGSVDVFTTAAPTMGRDLHERTSGTGFTFSVPHMYGGITFGGNEFFVKCANDLNTQGDCSGLQVCATPGTTHASTVELILPAAHIVLVSTEAIAVAFVEGRCNVIIAHNWDLALVLIGDELFGPGQVMGNTLTYESLSLVTRDDDPHWSEIVNSVIQSLITGEAQGITQSMAQDFVSASNFGLGSEFVLQTAIATVGNYGEMYERHYEWFLPRSEINLINVNGTTGLLRTPFFGGLSDSGPEPVAGGEVEVITMNGHLTCGITDQSPGFAEFNSTSGRWSGLDVDYCRALASSLFFGRVTDETLIFRQFDRPEEGHSALVDGTVDVLCGQRVSLRGDMSGCATCEVFAFSLPYFYEAPDSFGSTRALATRQFDPQWSSFVYWSVASTIHAEEEKITQSSSNAMPEVKLFGPNFRRMFRDAILAVGSYEEMYARNVEAIVPRSGFNLLSTQEPIGPQHFPFPFNDGMP